MNTNPDLQQWVTLLRVSEQKIFAQSIEDKNQKIRDLESQVRYLRELLTQAVRVPQPQAAPGRLHSTPRRWNVH